jgi:hypothetical protein
MDPLLLDNMDELCRILSDKQIHASGPKYGPKRLRPRPAGIAGQNIYFFKF